MTLYILLYLIFIFINGIFWMIIFFDKKLNIITILGRILFFIPMVFIFYALFFIFKRECLMYSILKKVYNHKHIFLKKEYRWDYTTDDPNWSYRLKGTCFECKKYYKYYINVMDIFIRKLKKKKSFYEIIFDNYFKDDSWIGVEYY